MSALVTALLAVAACLVLVLLAGQPSAPPSEIVPGGILTQPFGCSSLELEPPEPSCPQGHFHSGIDLAAPEGTAVLAPAAGVAAIGRGSSCGTEVLIDHGGGVQTLYCHLAAALVAGGQLVVAGERLGNVGATGLATGPHLHFEVHAAGRPVDPRSLAAPASGPNATLRRELKMVNKVILIGRLAADPELRATAAGVQVANVRMATNNYAGRDAEGNRKEHTDFHSLVLFGRQAEIAGEYLRKGRLVYADGRLQTRSWDDAEGKRHWATEIVVDSLQMLGPKPDEAA